jgi:peptidoglycan/xylan/chitin deacetylase (PgdA/CDA1 family)
MTKGELAQALRGSLRATVKGVLRHAALGVGHALQREPQTAPRILTYHGVCPVPPDEWSVTPDQLRRHARLLAGSFCPVSLLDVVRWQRGELELPPRAVAVTFDDGLRDVLTAALPILADAGIPATAFIAPGLVAGQPPHPSYRPTRPFLSWAELKELARAGWTIGSHALTHPILAELPADAAAFELRESRRILADACGVAVTLLAYPYGTRRTVSAREYGLARAAGYEAAFLDMTAPLLRQSDPLALPRSKVLRTDSLSVVRASLEGRMDVWRLIEAR